MKGHIRERSPGRWAIVIDLPDPETGKRRRKWHSFEGTKREAQVECARLISELNGGLYIEAEKITVRQFLDRWLEHIKPRVSPRTHERYGEIVRMNLNPLLGAVVLTKLRPMQISDAYARALSSGRRDGKGGLSASTVRYMHVILKASMAQAMRWQVLARSPIGVLVEGETLTPMLLARRFTLNPVLIIWALVFWFWMWGIPGAILAVPMLAILKIVCDRLRPLKALGHFLVARVTRTEGTVSSA
jgi:hypothetical protein